MLKRALPAVLGALGLCLPLAAQQANEYQTITVDQLQETGELDFPSALALYQPNTFSRSGNSILIYGFPTLTLLDGRRFLISGPLGRLGPADVLPLAVIDAVSVQKINASPIYGTDSPGGVLDFRLNRTVSGGGIWRFLREVGR